MTVFWNALIVVGLALQLLLISALVRGPLRVFPVLFAYTVTLFLTTVAEAAAFNNPEIWAKTSSYYWLNDAIRQLLIFILVISLVDRGMINSPGRSSMRRRLIVGALLFTALSIYFSRDPVFGLWMTTVSRNLGFCAVILNLVLWAVLIKSKHEDRRLLMISGGLGIQMAGKAIGHSLRQISPAAWTAGNLVIVVSHLFCLYIWWRALRSFDRAPAERYNKV